MRILFSFQILNICRKCLDLLGNLLSLDKSRDCGRVGCQIFWNSCSMVVTAFVLLSTTDLHHNKGRDWRLVYFITSVHNEVKSIPELFQTIDQLLLSFPGSSVVVVDNNSTDGSGELLEIETKRRDRALFLSNPQGKGWGDGISKGLEFTGTGVPWVSFPSDLQFPLEDIIKTGMALQDLILDESQKDIAVLTKRSFRKDKARNRLRGKIWRQVARALTYRASEDPSSQLRGIRIRNLDISRLDSDFLFDLQMNTFVAKCIRHRVLEVGFTERKYDFGESSEYILASVRVLKKTIALRYRGGFRPSLLVPSKAP